ncbi:hypothetical protein F7725_024831 [Dissostichus mawsoni]|uniref:Uncharacterized protein n=1 Tax=Dissostichus mawsoni TaxID=36200 RepID=A0A7J5XAH7_DISMA|nr:hypothetical protein F7725_024831 [Dissostichus mawsoni]
MTLSLSTSVLLFRRPCGRGVVSVECVFSYMRARLASEDAIMRFLSLWDTMQRSPAGNAHVQQHSFLSGRSGHLGLSAWALGGVVVMESVLCDLWAGLQDSNQEVCKRKCGNGLWISRDSDQTLQHSSVSCIDLCINSA